MPLVVTNKGRERLATLAAQNPPASLNITKVKVGTMQDVSTLVDATNAHTAMQAAAADITTLSSSVLSISSGSSRVLRNIRITGSSSFRGDEVGFFEVVDGTDTLVMYWADAASTIFTKSSANSVLLTAGISFVAGTPADITESVMVSSSAPASTTTSGTVELADAAELAAGTSDDVVPTVAGVKSMLSGITVSDASETKKGVSELAANSELDVGTDSTRVTTVRGVKRMIDRFSQAAISAATTTKKGLVELATNSELDAGTSNNHVPTVAGVKRMSGTVTVPDATFTSKGKVELASNSELDGGTNDNRVATPKGVKRMIDRFAEAAVRTATTSARGKVKLATTSELGTALNGSNPSSANENDVITLEAMYQQRSKFGGQSTAYGDFEVRIYTSSGTWSKPTGARVVTIILWNGGQGANQHRGGYGGGAFAMTVPATLLPSSLTVTVGAAGSGISTVKPGKSYVSGGGGTFPPVTSSSVPASRGQYINSSVGLGTGRAYDGFKGGAGGNPFEISGYVEAQHDLLGGSGGNGSYGSAPGGGGGGSTNGGYNGAKGRVYIITGYT